MSLIVHGNDGYLRTVCDYVHLNPERAKLLEPEERLRAFAWTALQDRSIGPWLLRDPLWDGIRAAPQFQRLLQSTLDQFRVQKSEQADISSENLASLSWSLVTAPPLLN